MAKSAAPSSRTQVKRRPNKASYDKDLAYSIIDQALIAYIAITDETGQPYSLPVGIARDGDRLLLHGSAASRLFRRLIEGHPCSATISLLDGLVMARSSFESSIHYRSVVIFGRAYEVTGEEKMRAFDAIVKHLMPGRELEVRKSTEVEAKQTAVAALPIAEFSIKVSNLDVGDLPEDLDSPLWAGIIPIEHRFGTPINAGDLKPGIPVPEYIAKWPNGRT